MQLDFPAAYLGLLMGRSGTHIKALCQQHKVAVHFTGEEEGKGKESHVAGSAVWVVVKHKLGSSIEEFKEQLKQNAEKVVKNRKKHEISVSGECVGLSCGGCLFHVLCGKYLFRGLCGKYLQACVIYVHACMCSFVCVGLCSPPPPLPSLPPPSPHPQT